MDGTLKKKENKHKKHPEGGYPDPERQIWYVLTHKWLLDMKEKTQSTIHNPRERRQ